MLYSKGCFWVRMEGHRWSNDGGGNVSNVRGRLKKQERIWKHKLWVRRVFMNAIVKQRA